MKRIEAKQSIKHNIETSLACLMKTLDIVSIIASNKAPLKILEQQGHSRLFEFAVSGEDNETYYGIMHIPPEADDAGTITLYKAEEEALAAWIRI
jgi:hypothetical protein